MKRFDSILLKVFLYGLPVVVLITVTNYFYNPGAFSQSHISIRWLNDLTGLIFLIWMALSLYLSFRLMVSETFRDQVLARVTFIRERDEREALLTGKAARTTFLTTLAILIFLFFLSCFQVSVIRLPQEKTVNGHDKAIVLSIGFKLLEHSKIDMPKDANKNEEIFSYTSLPISSTTLILMLILWKIISYNYSMRRLTR